MTPMSSAETLRLLRLAAQRIEGSEFRQPVEVVRWMLAIQGQDLPGAKWSIGLRAPGSTLVDVDTAINSGQIIRSWPMRGTLHVVVAQDIGWMLGLTAERMLRSLTTRHRQLDIDDTAIARAGEIASGALEGGRSATRTEMMKAFEEAGVATTGQRGYHLLGALHQQRRLCLGPTSGNEQAFVLLEEWVPDLRVLERDEALAEFVRRYFFSHGPATIRDFAWWTKLPLGDARIGLALARDSLEELVVDGVSHWMAPGLAHRVPARSVRALPGFDEYILGYTDRSASLTAAEFQAIVPGGNGVFQPTIVVDGRVLGTWRRTRGVGGVTVTPVPFAPLSRRDRAGFETAIREYGTFLGGAATVTALE